MISYWSNCGDFSKSSQSRLLALFLMIDYKILFINTFRLKKYIKRRVEIFITSFMRILWDATPFSPTECWSRQMFRVPIIIWIINYRIICEAFYQTFSLCAESNLPFRPGCVFKKQFWIFSSLSVIYHEAFVLLVGVNCSKFTWLGLLAHHQNDDRLRYGTFRNWSFLFFCFDRDPQKKIMRTFSSTNLHRSSSQMSHKLSKKKKSFF